MASNTGKKIGVPAGKGDKTVICCGDMQEVLLGNEYRTQITSGERREISSLDLELGVTINAKSGGKEENVRS